MRRLTYLNEYSNYETIDLFVLFYFIVKYCTHDKIQLDFIAQHKKTPI